MPFGSRQCLNYGICHSSGRIHLRQATTNVPPNCISCTIADTHPLTKNLSFCDQQYIPWQSKKTIVAMTHCQSTFSHPYKSAIIFSTVSSFNGRQVMEVLVTSPSVADADEPELVSVSFWEE